MRLRAGTFTSGEKVPLRNPTSTTCWKWHALLPKAEDSDLVIAALLHDAIEDQEVPPSSSSVSSERKWPTSLRNPRV